MKKSILGMFNFKLTIDIMMKPFQLLLFFIAPFFAVAQDIASNDVDPFTNERTIQTNIIPLKQGITNGFGISFTAVNDNYYLNVIGYGGVNGAINATDKIWFVLEDGKVVQFNSRVDMEANQTETKNIYIHHYFAKAEDIESLKNQKLAIFRISSGKTLTDVKISKKVSKKMLKVTEAFHKEVNKYNNALSSSR